MCPVRSVSDGVRCALALKLSSLKCLHLLPVQPGHSTHTRFSSSIQRLESDTFTPRFDGHDWPIRERRLSFSPNDTRMSQSLIGHSICRSSIYLKSRPMVPEEGQSGRPGFSPDQSSDRSPEKDLSVPTAPSWMLWTAAWTFGHVSVGPVQCCSLFLVNVKQSKLYGGVKKEKNVAKNVFTMREYNVTVFIGLLPTILRWIQTWQIQLEEVHCGSSDGNTLVIWRRH